MPIPLHLVLKFPNDTTLVVDGNDTDTITEHKQLYESKNRLIWGQGSQRKSSGVAEKKRDRIKKQIKNDIKTYTFFLANNKDQRELHVGKMFDIYDKGKIPIDSPLKNLFLVTMHLMLVLKRIKIIYLLMLQLSLKLTQDI